MVQLQVQKDLRGEGKIWRLGGLNWEFSRADPWLPEEYCSLGEDCLWQYSIHHVLLPLPRGCQMSYHAVSHLLRSRITGFSEEYAKEKKGLLFSKVIIGSAHLTALMWIWSNTLVGKRILRGNFTWITGAKRCRGQLQFDFNRTRISPRKSV